MFTMTQEAKTHLATVLDRSGATPATAFRIVVEGPQINLHPDTERKGDAAFASDERTVLLADPEVMRVMEDRVLDVETNPSGESHLTLK